MSYVQDERRSHLILYHLAWCPTRAQSVLTGVVADGCREAIRTRCADEGWSVRALDVEHDHVSLVVQAHPRDSAAEVVKSCKKAASQALRRKFTRVRELHQLWARHYFAATAGAVTPEDVRRYVSEQTGA